MQEAARAVLLAQPVEEVLHRAGIGRTRRPDADVAPVAQLHVAHLIDRVCGAAAELLSDADESPLDRAVKELVAYVGMGYVDQRDGTLGERATEQVRGPVLGDHPVNVRARDRHRLPWAELDRDRGPAGRRA